MAHKIPSDFHNCATCTHWCGRVLSDYFNRYVEFDPNEHARCAGGGCNGASMRGVETCPRWERRFK